MTSKKWQTQWREYTAEIVSIEPAGEPIDECFTVVVKVVNTYTNHTATISMDMRNTDTPNSMMLDGIYTARDIEKHTNIPTEGTHVDVEAFFGISDDTDDTDDTDDPDYFSDEEHR